jgi:hypothetical protein
MTFVDRTGSETPWIPAVLDEVLIEVDSVKIFYGRILNRSCEFTVDLREGFVTSTCEVADMNDKLSVELINVPVAAGTLIYVLNNSVIPVLTPGQGITLHESQATGPDLDAQLFAWSYCRDVLDHLSTLTGWVWRVDEDLKLRMWEIGSLSSGVTFNEANRNIRSVTTTQDATGYRNTQWLIYGPTQDGVPVEETFDGDGLTRNFDLGYDLNGGWPPNVITRSDTGVTVPCGPDTSWEWSYDSVNNRVVQTGGTPVADGYTLTVPYTVGFPQIAVYQDSGEFAANGSWARKDEAPTIFDFAEAYNTAEALVRNNIPRPERVALRTGTSVAPGYTVTLALPELGIASAEYLCSAVTTEYIPTIGGGAEVVYELELIGGSERQADWVDFWRDIVGGTGGGGGTISGGISAGGAGSGTVLSSPGAVYLGGSNTQEVTHSTAVMIPEAIPVELDSTAYPSGTVTVRCSLRTRNAGTTVTARLVCLDDSSTCGESSAVNTTGTPPDPTTGWTRVKFGATLVTGVKWYALYLVPSNNSYPVMGKGGYLV